MSKDTGGPAFPFILQGPKLDGDSPGMSLRDWFAGQALAGRCLMPALANQDPEIAAARAYEIADAMLAERKKQ